MRECQITVIAPVDAESNLPSNEVRNSYTSKAEFGEPHDDNQSDEEDIVDGRKIQAACHCRLGNADDAEVYAEEDEQTNAKGKRRIANGVARGESNHGTTLQFMIKERAMMELESAKLKRENDELRRSLNRERPQPANTKVVQTALCGLVMRHY